MKRIVRLTAIAILSAAAPRPGGVLAQPDLNVWAEDCAQGPAPDRKRCDLVHRLNGLLEGRERLVALGVTVTSHDGRLVWTAVRGLKPRSAGIIVDNSPVVFSFNCSEEYCFFRGNADSILQQMRVGRTAIVRLTSPAWDQHDFVLSLSGFAPLYHKALEAMRASTYGYARPG